MAHFAQLDKNNFVMTVIEIDDLDAATEQIGIDFCQSLLGAKTKWKQTSSRFRRQFAGIGFQYIEDQDIFLEPIPVDGFSYYLDKETYTWKSTNKPEVYIGFAPSSETAIENLLDHISWSDLDKFVDLGSGDGRVCIAAAKRGMKSYGVEANPNLFQLSKNNANQLQIEAIFIQDDLLNISLDNYTIIFMYLGKSICDAIFSKIKNLPPGITIISGDYAFPNWTPINIFEFDYQKFYVWKT